MHALALVAVNFAATLGLILLASMAVLWLKNEIKYRI